jgi:hypothetical protein
MSQKKEDLCQDLLPYIVSDLSNEQRIEFEEHVNHCSKCFEELYELGHVWESLPLCMDEVEPPADLKAQVFSSLIPDESNEPSLDKLNQQSPVKSSAHKSGRWEQWKRFNWGKVAVVLFFLIIGVIWNNMQLRGQLSALQYEMSSPVKVTESYIMVAANPSIKESLGSAWVLQNGDNKRLVLHMNGLAVTKGEEVYQVWLIHNGQRKNAGTFRVNEAGKGMITYHFTDPKMQFESIGITLEPDPYGDQPRGKKISGTT